MAEAIEIPKVKAGSKVILVGVKGAKFPAKVTSAGADEDGKIDLEGGGHKIHSVPYDPTGTRPDSWHAIAEEPKAAPAQKEGEKK